eukprot:TRINITY_DN2092_c0_g1_i3.p1 TRINITY_DN2092_c0_g1~~TRINITY_DN2092_c0_g1_i3.p1  ORF type:complete len:420 (+),score=41.56 TRINITY_DN2092_c0_g1_i3:57-1316(+)
MVCTRSMRLSTLSLCVVLCASSLRGRKSTRASRQGALPIAPQWSANMVVTGDSLIYGDYFKGQFFSDSLNNRFRMTWQPQMDAFHPKQFVGTLDVLSTTEGPFSFTHNGASLICQPNFSFPAWDWNASSAGNSTVGGVPCEVWKPEGDNYSVCIASDGVPRELNITKTIPGFFGRPLVLWGFAGNSDVPTQIGTHFLFTDVKVGLPSKDDFLEPAACARYPDPAPLCPTDGRSSTVTLDIYRLLGDHEDPTNISSRDTADSLGELWYIRENIKNGGYDFRNKFVSHWTITANASWGQFQQCNYVKTLDAYRCYPDAWQNPQPGRATPENMLEPLGGQCTPNTDSGSWYTFPERSRCEPGEELGTHGCKWQGAYHGRVNFSCLAHDMGLLDTLQQEMGSAPWLRSAELLRTSFGSSCLVH